jgi:cell division protein FtsB
MSHSRVKTSFGKEVYYILCVVIFIVSAIFSVVGPGGYKELRKAQRELESHRLRAESLKRGNQELIGSIQALRSDKTAIEKYARQKGYARAGEIIQQLPSEPVPAENRSPSSK